MNFDPGGQRFSANAPLRTLLVAAWHLNERQVSGGPAWLDSDRFEIDAKAAGPVSRQQMDLMLQRLLSERFNLTLIREPREFTVAAVTIEKGGPKLSLSTAAGSPPSIRVRASSNRGITVTGQNVTIAFIASYLSGRLDRLIIDDTGLAGSFDFSADLEVDRGDLNDPNVSERESITHMFSDLAPKLGLKLITRKAPLETIMIRHAEKPSEN